MSNRDQGKVKRFSGDTDDPAEDKTWKIQMRAHFRAKRNQIYAEDRRHEMVTLLDGAALNENQHAMVTTRVKDNILDEIVYKIFSAPLNT